jgi:hypothetical protein
MPLLAPVMMTIFSAMLEAAMSATPRVKMIDIE